MTHRALWYAFIFVCLALCARLTTSFQSNRPSALKLRSSSSRGNSDAVHTLGLLRDTSDLELKLTDKELVARSLLTPDSDDIWTARRKITRSAVSGKIKEELKREEQEREERLSGEFKELSQEEFDARKNKANFLVTAAFIAGTGVILRIGGRGALLGVLGLDFGQDNAMTESITSLISAVGPEALGSTSYLVWLGLWVGAKVLCLDAATIVLALSSGVVFGGVLKGTAISVLCSSLGSSANFFLARTSLRDKTRRIIKKKPALRALDKTCSKEDTGFKTVFSLRLSPLIPIPIAAYAYVFGATSISYTDWLLGTALGSIKPYALDSYLGMVVMGTMTGEDQASGPGGDLALLAVVAAVLLVGSFATQVAGAAWEETQRELAEEEEVARTRSTGGAGSAIGGEEEEEDDIDFIDLLPLPEGGISWFKGVWKSVIEDNVGAAWSRLEAVIEDETLVVRSEIDSGKEYTGMWEGEKEGGKGGKSGNSDEMVKAYPGTRSIRTYELDPLGKDNAGSTLESTLFAFALIKAISTPSPSSSSNSSISSPARTTTGDNAVTASAFVAGKENVRGEDEDEAAAALALVVEYVQLGDKAFSQKYETLSAVGKALQAEAAAAAGTWGAVAPGLGLGGYAGVVMGDPGEAKGLEEVYYYLEEGEGEGVEA